MSPTTCNASLHRLPQAATSHQVVLYIFHLCKSSFGIQPLSHSPESLAWQQSRISVLANCICIQCTRALPGLHNVDEQIMCQGVTLFGQHSLQMPYNYCCIVQDIHAFCQPRPQRLLQQANHMLSGFLKQCC